MKLILIGYMGVGKSAVGRYLSKLVGEKYYDLDDLIVKNEKKSILEIFTHQKEDYFRKREKKILELFFENHNNYILSLGGGTPCYFDNFSFVKKHAKVIYLSVDSLILAGRLSAKKNNYPLLAKLQKEEILDFIKNHLKQREKFYKQAHYKFEVSNKSIEQVALEIKNFL